MIQSLFTVFTYTSNLYQKPATGCISTFALNTATIGLKMDTSIFKHKKDVKLIVLYVLYAISSIIHHKHENKYRAIYISSLYANMLLAI